MALDIKEIEDATVSVWEMAKEAKITREAQISDEANIDERIIVLREAMQVADDLESAYKKAKRDVSDIRCIVTQAQKKYTEVTEQLDSVKIEYENAIQIYKDLSLKYDLDLIVKVAEG